MEKEYKYMVCTCCFTYNHAPYIVDAMNGFTMQETAFPVVTLIVDDASTDGEPEIIRQYLTDHFKEPYRTEETEYAHIICAHHRSNTNCKFVVFLLKFNHYRIKKSKFPYLSEWCDNAKYHSLCEGDDYWIEPNKLQMQVDLLEVTPNVSLVHTDCNVLYLKSGVVVPACNTPFIEYYNNADKKQTIENILLAKCKVRTATVLYRQESYKTFIKQNEFAYNSGYFLMGDIQLWIGLLQQGSGAYIPEVTAVYRVSDGTASRPKKYYSNIRFQLSSKELRIYYNQKYGYLQNEIGNIIKDYKHLLRIYREYDPSFMGIQEVDKLYDNSVEHCLFKLKNVWWHIKYDLHRVKAYLTNR